MQTATVILLWFGAIGCGVIAGVYFAFSFFIMTALAQLPPAGGIAAMQAINQVILRSPFMPLFFGTSLGAAVLALVAVLDIDGAGNIQMLAGGLVHVVAMFLVTVSFNVPLNETLDRAGEDAETVWRDYLDRWTRWNHLRTMGSASASALFVWALVARQTPLTG